MRDSPPRAWRVAPYARPRRALPTPAPSRCAARSFRFPSARSATRTDSGPWATLPTDAGLSLPCTRAALSLLLPETGLPGLGRQGSGAIAARSSARRPRGSGRALLPPCSCSGRPISLSTRFRPQRRRVVRRGAASVGARGRGIGGVSPGFVVVHRCVARSALTAGRSSGVGSSSAFIASAIVAPVGCRRPT
jgi:hypothetical protein